MRLMLFSIPFLCLLALPLRAQEESLHGTWEGAFLDPEGNASTTRLTFGADGVFELNSVTELGEGFQSFVEAAEISAEKITVHGVGTYRVAGDKLSGEVPEFEILVDGREFLEVFTEVARALARFAADLAGISDEDYPAFEETFVADFLADFDERQFIAGFLPEATYAIEGDTLYLTTTEDGVEETVEFQRVADATNVTRTSWGDLKASFGE